MIPPERYNSVGELLRDACITYKTETALLEYDRKNEKACLSYLDVKRQGERLARRLQDAGVGAGDRVAIVMSNQSKWLIAAYAILYRGAVLVPLDYKLTGPELESLLQHAKPKVLITEFASWRTMKNIEELECLKIVSEMPDGTEGTFEAWDAMPDTPGEFVPRQRSDQATLVYSSGTGGQPKGCMLTHDNYLEQYRTLIQLFPFKVGDRYFSILPTNHAIDFMVGFVGPFACGATVVHQRSLRPDLIRWVMTKKKITHMAVVPLILEAFERAIRENLDKKNDVIQVAFEHAKRLNAALTLQKPRRGVSRRLMKPVLNGIGPRLKMLFVGGAFVDPDRAQFFYDVGLPVVIGYGLTEACTVLTVNDLRPFRSDSVGRPLEGVEIEIRNADDKGVGEVWVKSRTVFAGYLDEPELTAEVLQDGWLRTGDLGWRDPSGHLHLVGRSKNMIVTAGGKNIYPEDIEIAFEGVDCEELVVFASGYVWPASGGKELTKESLFAVVRGKDGSVTDDVLADLRQRNHKLPDFKRVAGVLDWDDAFPRTASMKVKRGILAEQIREKANVDAIRRIALG